MSYHTLTIKDKLEVIAYYEKEKPNVRDLAKRFNIGKTQAANIIKNMNQIREQAQINQNEAKRKRFFSPQGKIVDTFCYDWYMKCIKENQPVSGRLIKEKALEIAQNIQYSGFCASNGWLQRWRLRHNVNLKPKPDNFNSYNFNKYIANGTEANTFFNTSNAESNYFDKNAWNSTKQNTESSRSHKRTFEKVDHEADCFDPLAFTEVSYGNDGSQDDDDDDIIFVSENENRFKIDSYASALNAIEDLKNFAQDDDIALTYLIKIECHFQKERLK